MAGKEIRQGILRLFRLKRAWGNRRPGPCCQKTMVTYADYKREKENLAELKRVADRLSRDIVDGKVLSRQELEQRIEKARSRCQELFPDRVELFELIYRPRFQRLWDQFRG